MRKRTLGWLVAVVVAFVLGFLLAWWLMCRHPGVLPLCSQAGQSASATTTSSTTDGGKLGRGEKTPGTGSPVRLGAEGGGVGSVTGGGAEVTGSGEPVSIGGGGNGNGDLAGGGFDDASGNTVSSGVASTANGGGGQIDGGTGGGSGTVQPGTSHGPTESEAAAASNTGTAPVPPGSGDSLQLGPDDPDLPIKLEAPGDRVVGARNLRYDRSELPRYPNTDRVASAMVVPPGGAISDGDITVATILTKDDPDTVAAWYRAHLPSSWTGQTPPSPEETDQAARQASTSAPTDTPIDSLLKVFAGAQLQQAQPGLEKARAAHLTFFWPPDQSTDTRSVMILIDEKTGETAVVLSKKARRP